jgi:hypothetical protein
MAAEAETATAMEEVAPEIAAAAAVGLKGGLRHKCASRRLVRSHNFRCDSSRPSGLNRNFK